MGTLQPPCPKCSAPNTRWLEFTSVMNHTNAFQCVACGHAWQEPVILSQPRRATAS
jgi:Zn ribbon nucleic-acid-binding protein